VTASSVGGLAVRVQEESQRAVQVALPAFADIVREHQGMVFSLAWHYLHDRALAEEMAQEVFLELYRHIGSIQSPEHLLYWLRKVASRKCIDQTRRRAFWPKFGLDDIPEPPAKMRQADPMLSGTLAKLVASLPEKARMLVILRYQEDLDPSDIARVLDMPVGTVKSHLQRALGVLREKLVRSVGEIAL